MPEELRYTVEAPCRRVHSSIDLYSHGYRWVWISLPRLLIFPCLVSIVPHCHICSRVSLHSVLIVLLSF